MNGKISRFSPVYVNHAIERFTEFQNLIRLQDQIIAELREEFNICKPRVQERERADWQRFGF